MTPALQPWLARHRDHLWLALRMLISATAAYALAQVFGLAQGYWAVLTAIIVTQNSVGGSLKAALDRLIGSVCGALVGVAAGLLLSSHAPLVVGATMIAALTPLAVLTAFYPTYRIAPITAIIVLMSTGAATLGPLGFALDRVLEVTLGAVIGVVVSTLIAPAHAYAQLRTAAAETAGLLAQVMTALAQAISTEAITLGALPTQIQATLNRLATAADDAARERRSRLSDHPDPEPLFRTLRRLQQDILALNRLFGSAWPDAAQEALVAPWSTYAEGVAATLRTLADTLIACQPPPDIAPLRTQLADFIAAIETMRREGTTRALPTDVVGRILGSAFRAEQLQRDLEDLTERTHEVAATH
jgi:uncharacterized membrane protein YccC